MDSYLKWAQPHNCCTTGQKKRAVLNSYNWAVLSSHNWAPPLHELSQQEEAAKTRFCPITIKQSNKHNRGGGGEGGGGGGGEGTLSAIGRIISPDRPGDGAGIWPKAVVGGCKPVYQIKLGKNTMRWPDSSISLKLTYLGTCLYCHGHGHKQIS